MTAEQSPTHSPAFTLLLKNWDLIHSSNDLTSAVIGCLFPSDFDLVTQIYMDGYYWGDEFHSNLLNEILEKL
jgi:hypothetical protein